MRHKDEGEIKHALGIDSGRNLSKDKMMRFAAMMPDMGTEMALKIVEPSGTRPSGFSGFQGHPQERTRQGRPDLGTTMENHREGGTRYRRSRLGCGFRRRQDHG
ncbi:hypothetical protein [Streptomyces muensis]|uniref:Uncharacterized protein n=1 Tax=Streptomyces muensis TaxID=1077944 RepID=A0A9X1TMX3_STRM4|nr:hypothetical protein [Streptomyces muensis]MCF1596139.1 hypothetical protein [Streptomyces muensis]